MRKSEVRVWWRWFNAADLMKLATDTMHCLRDVIPQRREDRYGSNIKLQNTYLLFQDSNLLHACWFCSINQLTLPPCAHTYIHLCTHIHTFMHTHVYVYAHTYIYTHTCVHTWIHTHTHMHTNSCMHTHIQDSNITICWLSMLNHVCLHALTNRHLL